MGYFNGGLYQFTTQNSRGWPRNDALTQRIHSVQADTSVFGALKYDRTVTNKWRYDSLAFNVTLSILFLTATIYCFAIISFDCSHIQFSISTLLICVGAVAITLTVLTNERELHRFVFQNYDSQLPDFSVRSLAMLGWNDRLIVVSGLFFTAFLGVMYTARMFSKLFGAISPRPT
ncbi:hypothetical protein Poly51_11810 [Rubripirellula tenax]|uniref:Uncharacterized protein n=2 Tax=Rubripirellula tenax TaxID=2528015 RepID=A0A5C6FLE3_9BACT|nr:hypothetical protein Poly51_11810 [Rubripirellula tenax]